MLSQRLNGMKFVSSTERKRNGTEARAQRPSNFSHCNQTCTTDYNKMKYYSSLLVTFFASGVSSQLFNGQHAPCNVCGESPLTVTLPFASIGTLDGVSFGNCLTLSRAGENGFLSPTQCLFVQSSAELKESCGCTTSMAPTNVPKGKDNSSLETPPSPPSITPGSNPVCFVCGSETTRATKPDALIEVPPELNSPLPVVPCGTIVEAGLSRLIPLSACMIAQQTAEFAEICGCEDTAPPMLTPTAPPSDPQTELVNDEPKGEEEPQPSTLPTESPENRLEDELESGTVTMSLEMFVAIVVIVVTVAF